MNRMQSIISWVFGIFLSIVSFYIGWITIQIISVETFLGLNNMALFCLIIPALIIGCLIYFTGENI